MSSLVPTYVHMHIAHSRAFACTYTCVYAICLPPFLYFLPSPSLHLPFPLADTCTLVSFTPMLLICIQCIEDMVSDGLQSSIDGELGRKETRGVERGRGRERRESEVELGGVQSLRVVSYVHVLPVHVMCIFPSFTTVRLPMGAIAPDRLLLFHHVCLPRHEHTCMRVFSQCARGFSRICMILLI